MQILNHLKCFAVICFLLFAVSCRIEQSQTNNRIQNSPTPQKTPSKIIADKFAYPIGKTETVTQAKDKKDDWYNAQDFGENTHLGEDWNKNSGGNSDCGEPVFAAANGTIVYAENAGEGWGNILIIEHDLPNGERVQTLYGHLRKILKASGETVKMREQIGEVGNADGRYLCHLHFELRTPDCPMWNEAGAGYSTERRGWLDPSDFIDAHRKN
ncbi:MAG: M23 family metallopeptidase [Pyrinomonadaceae bacterium]